MCSIAKKGPQGLPSHPGLEPCRRGRLQSTHKVLSGPCPWGPKHTRVAGSGLQTPAAGLSNHQVNPTRRLASSSQANRGRATTRSARGTRWLTPRRSYLNAVHNVHLLRFAQRHGRHATEPPRSSNVICPRRPRADRAPPSARASSVCAAAAPAATAAAATAGSSMGFSCAPPRVWTSPGSRGASCWGSIAAARGRVPGRGLQGEAAGAPPGAWDWGTASGFTVSWEGELGLSKKAGVRPEARAGAGA